MGPASWVHGEQRGKLGVQLPVVHPQLSFLREFMRNVAGRAVPGPWKLPGLTLPNLLCSLEQAPSAYFSAPWKSDQLFQSRTFPCWESAHPDLSPLGLGCWADTLEGGGMSVPASRMVTKP